MKNIHILPTDKPSRLIIYSTLLNEFRLLNEPIEDWKHKKNIYITSDEEITNCDCYVINVVGEISRRTVFKPIKVTEDIVRKEPLITYPNGGWCKKIILTTDVDLIKDGVQAIDDEFLEWFVAKTNDSGKPIDIVKVKNSILKIPNRYDDDYRAIPYLKIIIPKEEPVFSQLEVGKDFEQEEFELGEEEVECNMCGNIMSLLEDESIYVCFNSECTRCYEEYKEEHKQETLEEAAEKYDENNTNDEYGKSYRAFISGAKWQAEKSYSEEEVLDIIENAFQSSLLTNKKISISEWFEQFKKK